MTGSFFWMTSSIGEYTDPYVEDIYNILSANKYFYTKCGDDNYDFHGGIICTNDGSEYLVTFTDREIAADFFLAKWFSF